MTALKTVLDFVDAINRADAERLGGMMSDDHSFIDSDGTRTTGRPSVEDAWRRYFTMMPDYKIAVEETYSRGSVVVLIGTASGTYAAGGELKDENRWCVPAAWRAVTKGNRIAVWQLFVNPEPIARVIQRVLDDGERD
jgi:ketosteroid isomerase-like protein